MELTPENASKSEASDENISIIYYDSDETVEADFEEIYGSENRVSCAAILIVIDMRLTLLL
jgi:hypothetical protein